ncbi:MAG: DUF3343 domain-containing protein [Firmicutes bacterium]|nr:DUF3343 domain-containing protein [Bacillota bacterium]
MREKKLRLIITFHTTTAAMAFESYCLAAGLPGRLIPVPTQITAGCGMAWMADPADRDVLEEAIKKDALNVDALYEVVH